MHVGKVIGTVWATKKEETLEGLRLLLVRPLALTGDESEEAQPLVSVDVIGAGIGEIVLVVIGILIALQINNWNEREKGKALEQEYYCRLLEDVELHGVKMRKGEDLVMYYASANRDDSVFDAPFAFDIARSPNRHLGFGTGEHFCLGAHVARLSMRALFLELANRVDTIELAGEPTRIASRKKRLVA